MQPTLRIALLATLALGSHALAADEIRLHGATTAIDRFVNPYKAEVEKTTGFKLTIIGNATGRGLADLAEGKCDASLALNACRCP
ncbi:hypothetical protein [Chitinimonas koreensis]|uniref:hypothetical protein n=1 Tax=Chitinimonas koreensis TaxID=356302 RepID=UPI00040008E0|nr:hypothetical protein [Chitinimonas koreensis]QNM98717.1 hypothetical protein H9L41_11140 [Chitinimonas koreensis]